MARSTAGERWAFIADYLDPSSGVRWTYQLFAYVKPEAAVDVEMVRTEELDITMLTMVAMHCILPAPLLLPMHDILCQAATNVHLWLCAV